MPTGVIDELVTQVKNLTESDRTEFLRRLNDSERPSVKPNGLKQKGYLHPNTVWIKKNKHKYPGNYVALKDGKLIAVGRTIKEADMAAKAKGVNDPLLHYILAEGEEAWGGW